MSRIHYFLAGVLAIGVLLGTSMVDAADPAEHEEALQPFTALSYEVPGELTLVAADDPYLTMTATERQREAIEVLVRDETLVLRRKKGSRFIDLDDVQIQVGFEHLRRLAVTGSGTAIVPALVSDQFDLSLSGSGDVQVASLKAKALALNLAGSGQINIDALTVDEARSNIAGSGDILLAGTAQAQSLNVAGSGDYRANELDSRQAEINIAGSGDASLQVREALRGSIFGSGDVRYRGAPEVAVRVLGSGTVEALEQAL